MSTASKESYSEFESNWHGQYTVSHKLPENYELLYRLTDNGNDDFYYDWRRHEFGEDSWISLEHSNSMITHRLNMILLSTPNDLSENPKFEHIYIYK